MDVGRAPDVGEGEGEEGRVDVAQGHDVQADVVLVEPEIDGIDEIERDVRLVGAHDALGRAGGPRGIDQDPGILRLDGCLWLALRRIAQQRLVLPVSPPLLAYDNIVLRRDLG